MAEELTLLLMGVGNPAPFHSKNLKDSGCALLPLIQICCFSLIVSISILNIHIITLLHIHVNDGPIFEPVYMDKSINNSTLSYDDIKMFH